MASADSDDRLAEAKRRIAFEHFGDEFFADYLRGGNLRQLRLDAERLRSKAGMQDNGRPSLQAELFAYRERRAAQAKRLFGERA